MVLAQNKFREVLFQVLFCIEFTEMPEEEMIQFLMKEIKTTKKNLREVCAKALEVKKHLPEIDELISSSSASYEFDRIAKVELSILRLGIYELLFEPKTPPKVAISEAIRLCRKFGTRESAKFINAILDKVYKDKNESAKE